MNGEGILAKYAKYGLGAYVYLPQFPRNKCFCSFFNLMPKSSGWGEERPQSAGMRGGVSFMVSSQPEAFYLTPSNFLRIFKTVTMGNSSLPSKTQAGWRECDKRGWEAGPGAALSSPVNL